MDGITPIEDETALDGALKADLAVLLKYSPTCPISAGALVEVQEFMRRRPGIPVFLVDVLSQRPLSQNIAASLGIRHESPQAIVLRRGAPL